MKKYEGVEVWLHAFLTSAIDGDGQLHAVAVCNTGTHWVGGWVGPRVGLDAVARRKVSFC